MNCNQLQNRTKLILQTGGIAGLIAPLAWLAAVLWGGYSTSGYVWARDLVSELAIAGHAASVFVTIVGFLVVGFSFCILGLCLAATGRPRSVFFVAGALLFVAGVARVLAGMNPCDVSCRPVVPSASQLVHDAAARWMTLATLASTILVGIAILWKRQDVRFGIWSVIAAIVGIVLLFMFSAHLHSDLAGLYQRMAVGEQQIWIFSIGIWMLRSTQNHRQAPN